MNNTDTLSIRFEQMKTAPKLDPVKLRALTTRSLEERIAALDDMVALIRNNKPLAVEAQYAVGSRTTEDEYIRARRQMQKELRRRKMDRNWVEPQEPWTPFVRGAAPDLAEFDTPAAWERYRALAAKDLTGMTAEEYRDLYVSAANDELYVNSRYQVAVRRYDADVEGEGVLQMVHLSIKRRDGKAVHDWRDLQRIKNELLGPNCEAIELYPAESRVVDTANQYHLWGFNSGTFRFPFGWDQGTLRLSPEEAGDLGAVGQREFEA